MKESFNPKEYRTQSAETLKVVRKINPESALDLLEKIRDTKEYQQAEEWYSSRRSITQDIFKSKKKIENLEEQQESERKLLDGLYNQQIELANDPFVDMDLRINLAKELSLDYVGVFSAEGVARAKQTKGDDYVFFFIDKTGKKISEEYDIATDFNDGVARVCIIPEGKHMFNADNFHINTEGKRLYSENYDLINDFKEGFASVMKDAKSSFIDKNGKKLSVNVGGIFSKPVDTFDMVSGFSEGLAGVLYNHKAFFINKEGKKMFKDTFSALGAFNQGLASVKKDGRSFFINKEGLNAFNKDFDVTGRFNDGLAPVRQGGKSFYINKNGEKAFEETFDDVHNFHEGFAQVVKDGKHFHINTEGKRIYPESYKWADDFHEGAAKVAVQQYQKEFHIDKEGKRLYKETYNYVSDFHGGIAKVKHNDEYFYIDYNGNRIPGFKGDLIG